MGVSRGMKRVRIFIIIITIPMIVLGAFLTYTGFVQVQGHYSALDQPGGPKVSGTNSDGEIYVLSPEDARESVLYALKLTTKMMNLGILLLTVSVGLWVLYWIISGFISERKPEIIQ